MQPDFLHHKIHPGEVDTLGFSGRSKMLLGQMKPRQKKQYISHKTNHSNAFTLSEKKILTAPLFRQVFTGLFLLIMIMSETGCQPASKKDAYPQTGRLYWRKLDIKHFIPYHSRELALLKAGLVDIQVTCPGIKVELKYAGKDNFMGYVLYEGIHHAFLQPDVAKMLTAAWKALQREDSSLTFLVYDATRPLIIQQAMWDAIMKTPAASGFYVSNPKAGSLHNYGAAIDITLCRKDGTPLDMGTPFDFFGPLAHPEFETRFLQEGKLSPSQVQNRRLLRKLMYGAGFTGIQSEWWHFNACSREVAAKKYIIVT